jgi:enoyl-CoA hydratase/carnithine racemase
MADVILEPQDERRVRVLRLNRPERANALSDELVADLDRALGEVEGDGTRVLIVTGNGPNFCGGFDFGGFEELSQEALGNRLIKAEGALARLRYATFLTVAAVNGPAIGAGADLVCACAYRVGLATARFRFPGFRFGVALGTRHLVNTIGAERARRILLEDLALDAEQSFAAGLLTHLATSGEDASAIIDALVARAGELDDWSLATILRMTSSDTSADDLADLTGSVRRAGLHHRLREYRARASGG